MGFQRLEILKTRATKEFFRPQSAATASRALAFTASHVHPVMGSGSGSISASSNQARLRITVNEASEGRRWELKPGATKGECPGLEAAQAGDQIGKRWLPVVGD